MHSEPEFKDADDKPYLSTDTVHANGKACAGRGEVWLRGNNVTVGYYKVWQKSSSWAVTRKARAGGVGG